MQQVRIALAAGLGRLACTVVRQLLRVQRVLAIPCVAWQRAAQHLRLRTVALAIGTELAPATALQMLLLLLVVVVQLQGMGIRARLEAAPHFMVGRQAEMILGLDSAAAPAAG
jgi:hypothetical protein